MFLDGALLLRIGGWQDTQSKLVATRVRIGYEEIIGRMRLMDVKVVEQFLNVNVVNSFCRM